MNGKCGLTLLRKCHSHKTQELVWAAERVKIRFCQTNDLFIEHIKIKIRFKDKTLSLTKHLTITARFYFQYFFLWIHRLFFQNVFLPFPPTIIECVEAPVSIPSDGTLLPTTYGKGNTCDKYEDYSKSSVMNGFPSARTMYAWLILCINILHSFIHAHVKFRRNRANINIVICI